MEFQKNVMEVAAEFPNSEQSKRESQSPSDKLDEYSKIMNLGGVEEMRKTRDIYKKSLANKSMISGEEWHNQRLQIQIVSKTANHQCLIFKICHHIFSFLVTVHFVNQVSPSHQIFESFNGNFSNVYRARIFDKEVAIKCNCYTSKNFLQIFENTLEEYLIFLITSQLNIGPHMEKSLGFDLIVYKNCVQFCMEFCEQKFNKCQEDYNHLQQDLKEGLKKLHSLNIIHFDIKPQNICYSKINKKYVFIDYGLHSIIRQQFGLKTFTNFRGSITFASQQMIECFQKSDCRFIDLYYNDAHCLKESLRQMKESLNYLQMKNPLLQVLQAFNITRQFILYIYKGILVYHYFIKNVDDKKIKSIRNYLQSLEIRLALEQAEYFHLRLKIMFDIQSQNQPIVQLNFTHFQFHQSLRGYKDNKLNQLQYKQTNFDIKLQALKKSIRKDLQSNCQMLTGKIYHLQIESLDDCWSLEKSMLYLHISKCFQFTAYTKMIEMDIRLAKIFNATYINYPLFETLQIYQMLNICYKQLIDYAITRDTLDNITFNIIKQCFQSITILQQNSMQDYYTLIDRIIRIKGTILRKIRMFLSLFFSLQWINSRIVSKYSYFKLMDKVYRQCKQYLKSLQKKEISEEEAQIISYVRLVMMPTIPLQLIKNMKMHNDFQIFLYHTLTNDYNLVLAQVYLYASYRLLSKKQRVPAQLQYYIYKNLAKLLHFELVFIYKQSLHFFCLVQNYYLVKQSILLKYLKWNNICSVYEQYKLKREHFIQHLQYQQQEYYSYKILSQNVTTTKQQLILNQHHLFTIKKVKLLKIKIKSKDLKWNVYLNLSQQAKRMFIIKQYFDFMDKPLINYHQHNLTQQVLAILQTIWELKKMFDLYTNQQIDYYLQILEEKIQESQCIECKRYALIYFTTYKACQKYDIAIEKIQDIFIGNYTYLIKTQSSTDLIIDYLSQYLYMINHNKHCLSYSPPFKYDYIDIIYQTAQIYNYFDIYFYLKRRKNRFKDVPVLSQTLKIFWKRDHQLYFQFLDQIYYFIDQFQKRKFFDSDFVIEICDCLHSLPLDSKDDFCIENYQFYKSKFKKRRSRSLAMYLLLLVEIWPNNLELPYICYIYIWRYIPKYYDFADSSLIPQFIKNITSGGKKVSPKRLLFLIKIREKTHVQWSKQIEGHQRIKIDQRWGNSSKIHQQMMISKLNAYYQKNKQNKNDHRKKKQQ